MDNDKTSSKVPEEFTKILQEKRDLQKRGIYINYVNPQIFQGKKVWAIGNKLYAGRDVNETFHDFVSFVLEDTLGSSWVASQQVLSQDNQHFIAKCFSEFSIWRKKLFDRNKSKNLPLIYAPANGYVQSLISLGFDVATLRHVSNISDSVLHRLRIPSEYQGARYEITIAGIFARLGFKIKWLENMEDGKTHCEFIATHGETGTQIAVEAKSRHRKGVLHTDGLRDERSDYKGDIQGLLNRAFKKTEYGQVPFFIFIDINAPFKNDEDFQKIPWVKDILKKAKLSKMNSQDNLSIHNVIYFTNFSFHYQTDQEAAPTQVLMASPQFVLHQIPNVILYKVILNALKHYGDVPDIN